MSNLYKDRFMLMFEDEVGFGRINKPKRCWCKQGIRPVVPCHRIREYVYAFGAVAPIDMLWDELREKNFKNELFKTLSAVVDRLCNGLVNLSNNKLKVKSITGWNWTLYAILKDN